MKKIITLALVSAALLAGTQAHAQLSIGAGYQVHKTTAKIAGTESTNNLNAIYAGASYNFKSALGIGFAPGAYYSYAFENTGALLQKEHAITIPLMFNFGYDFSDRFNASIAVGPAGSFAFGGKGVDTKTFNIGIGSALVFTFNRHIALNAGYEYGFLNRYKGAVNGASLKTSKLSFGISYLF